MKPKLYVLVGIVGAGKSTWIAKQPFDWTRTIIASTDNHVEKYAKEQGKTYSDVFQDYMPTAVKNMANDVADAVKHGYDIIWDQTSTTVNTRAKKLRMVPNTYEKIAVVFPTPDAKELSRRLASRPGKNIPQDVVNRMLRDFTMPTESEGFDRIITVDK